MTGSAPSCGSAATFGCTTTRPWRLPVATVHGVVPAVRPGPAVDSTGASRARTGRGSSLGVAAGLAADLESLGARLVVRVGDPAVVVPDIAARPARTTCTSSRDHAPYGRRATAPSPTRYPAGDRCASTRSTGTLVHEPEERRYGRRPPYAVYSPFRRAWERLPRRASCRRPARLGGHDSTRASSRSRGARPRRRPERGPALCPNPVRPPPEDASSAGSPGHRRLSRRPATGSTCRRQFATVGRSPPRPAVATEVVERADGDGEGRRTFRNELVWREFYAHVLFHRPSVRHAAFRRSSTRSSGRATRRLSMPGGAAGRAIRSSMPRCASSRATGWMPNRARMIAASFLTKDL